MNYLSRFFFTALFGLLIAPFLLSAQSTAAEEESESEKALRIYTEKQVNPADYIFEGTVLKFEYHRDENDSLWLTHLIQIHKVFRGDLQPGTVELVFLGRQPAFYKGDQPIYSNSGLGKLTRYTAPSGTRKGRTAMFFAKANKHYPKTILSNQTSNKVRLTHPGYSPYFTYKMTYYSKHYTYRGGSILSSYITKLITGEPLVEGSDPLFGYSYEHTFPTIKNIYTYILGHSDTKLLDYTQKNMTVDYIWKLWQKINSSNLSHQSYKQHKNISDNKESLDKKKSN